MSPIDRMPSEILSTIFLHVLPPFDAMKNPERVPNVLCQVCRLWHAFVLAHPALWASLNIKCSDRLLPPLHAICTHLLHSAAHPLSIVLETKSPNPDFPAVLAALAAARNRWRHVSVTLVSETAQEMIDVIAQGDTPLLQRFHCFIKLYPSGGSSRFRSVHCRDVHSWYGSWPQLTMLELDAALTISDCLVLLRLSPRLSFAGFIGIKLPGNVIPSRHLLHPTLRTLNVMGAWTTTLISALTLPALQDLGLHSSTGLAEHHTALPDLLARSAPPLHALMLTDLHIPEPILLRTLALAGELHTLSITELGLGCVNNPCGNTRPHYKWATWMARCVPLAASLVRALHPSPPSGTTPLCPRLRFLTLSNLDAPDGVCTAMLRARWGAAAHHNGVACLQAVHIWVKGDENVRDQAEMQALSAEGLKGSLIHIDY
ncbi:hypothetical protein BD779DRAFT_1675174 [Infundibulicybe gibba]|nr:hypothetical protein BD779DRAFT_1675174 [Infundibulicybe gibba]